MPAIELDEQKDEWLVAIKLYKKKRQMQRNDKNRGKKKDLACGQYTHVYKLNANWN